MRTEDFNGYTDGYREQIDAELKRIIDEQKYSDEFKNVLLYALFPGGKRLRPILLLEWHNVFSPPDEYALRIACGIEILHAYSLIHDDMPCMDNDDFRRGKPSVHKQFGEGMALLAGDALMDLGYRILCAPMSDGRASVFSACSGLLGDGGLICGQYRDLYGKIDDLNDLLEMYRLKTGALISLACVMGYALGNNIDCLAYKKIINKLRENTQITINSDERDDKLILDYVLVSGFAEAFGTAFQLYDDITEYIGGEKLSPSSVLNFMDLDKAKLMLTNRLNDAAKALDALHPSPEFLREFLNKFIVV